ncbi:hypothetical protein M3223_10035 [Paenibacillus pasadenensis]|uniref:hypothetical protein n=1 Tax=Paenibacillus pasadenensis TaxID=217090 RepID=UPI002041A133|nr:hypothetical protein [Paenibacillus pasadenensis]MCM3747695.1 hypothetical protein [Paenibacillus pasadenensis]
MKMIRRGRAASRWIHLTPLILLLSALFVAGCNFTSPVTEGWKSISATEGLDNIPGKEKWKKVTYRVTLQNVSGETQEVEWVEPVLKSNLLLNDPDRSLRTELVQTVENNGRLVIENVIEFDAKNVNLGSSQNVEFMLVKLKGRDEPIEVNV